LFGSITLQADCFDDWQLPKLVEQRNRLMSVQLHDIEATGVDCMHYLGDWGIDKQPYNLRLISSIPQTLHQLLGLGDINLAPARRKHQPYHIGAHSGSDQEMFE
jgi:hypothetical protein